MGKTFTIEEEIEIILDKVDNGDPLTVEERILHIREVMGIKDETRIQFILNGCDLSPEEKAKIPPGVSYEI